MQSNLKRLSKLTNFQLLIFSSLPDSTVELPFILPSNAASFPPCGTATLLTRIPAEREARQAFHALGAPRVPVMSRQVVFSTAVPRALWV